MSRPYKGPLERADDLLCRAEQMRAAGVDEAAVDALITEADRLMDEFASQLDIQALLRDLHEAREVADARARARAVIDLGLRQTVDERGRMVTLH